MTRVIACRPVQLPQDQWEAAADEATRENPANRPPLERMMAFGLLLNRKAIAVSTTKYWRGGGVDLTVAFLDNPDQELRKKILDHLNAWGKTANVRFRETRGAAKVRITRITTAENPRMGGYWSYIGTDILRIKQGQPTMNLEGFTMNTPEQEFRRVVRHEAGHTLGCEHEHMRRDVVKRIDRDAAYRYFMRMCGWNPRAVDQQVLMPIEERSVMGTAKPDETSIMCYQLPADIMKDGQPVPGGLDINDTDAAFMGRIYPIRVAPTRPGKKTRSKTAKKKSPISDRALKKSRRRGAA